jgi:carbamoyl-phosphate synthase large subunit
LVVGDADPLAPAALIAPEAWVMPRLFDLAPEQLAMELKARHIRAVLPTRDGELAYFAAAARVFSDHGVAVMIGSSAAVAQCRDKLAFRVACQRNAINAIPTFASIDDVPEAFEELVVKERLGAGSRGLVLGVSRVQAAVAASEMESPIFQPLINGTEISVDVYSSPTVGYMGAVARSRDLVVHGESQVTTVLPDSAAVAIARGVVEAIGLAGHAVVQLIDDGEQMHVIECNPRVGGASTLSMMVGLPTISWFLSEASGADPASIPFAAPNRPHRLVRVPRDFIL